MKKLFCQFFFASLLFGFSQYTTAQSAEDIVEQYFEAIGGKEKIGNIQSVKMSGLGKAQGMDLPIVIYTKAPGKMRLDMIFQGKEITQTAFDGETAWTTNFMTMEAEKMEQEDSDIMKAQMSFPDPLYNYKEKGFTISLEGEEEIEGADCFIVKLTRTPIMVGGEEVANEVFFFIDKETYVPIMQREYGVKGQMKGLPTETYMSDYDEVDGIYFPFTVSQKIDGNTMFDMIIEDIEINGEMSDDLFVFPAPVATKN